MARGKSPAKGQPRVKVGNSYEDNLELHAEGFRSPGRHILFYETGMKKGQCSAISARASFRSIQQQHTALLLWWQKDSAPAYIISPFSF